jgi:murein DD-endopeptidase MepM/ murein hydrolase activator NlpD
MSRSGLDLRSAPGLALLGLGSGMLLAAVLVSVSLWRAPRPRGAPPEAATPFPASLEFPVLTLARVSIEDSFGSLREDGARVHRALDIVAPRHTPVRAVADGRVARMSSGGAGGLALYEVDPAGAFCFYYAHLEAYAPGLQQGSSLRRGDVIGYVGTTGNAAGGAPHLHFAIFQLSQPYQLSGGRAIDPYPLLNGTKGVRRGDRPAHDAGESND